MPRPPLTAAVAVAPVLATLIALITLLGGCSPNSKTQTAPSEPPTATIPHNPYGLPQRALTHIGLGSCLHQDRSHEILTTLAKQDFDLFLFLGDNVYGDVDADTPTNMAPLETAYATLAKSPELQQLRDATEILAIWDDHDYGLNDAGADFAGKEAAEAIFDGFWDIPDEAPQRKRPGTYDSVMVGPKGQRVQLLMLDTRSFRSPLRETDEPMAEGKQRYLPDDDPKKTMLGEAQWQWLEEELKRPADLRLVLSSIQVIADGHGWEAWRTLPHERERLFELLRKTAAKNVVLLSGDRHRAGIYRRTDLDLGYPLWELTSSSLNLPIRSAREEPGPNRLGPSYLETNYGSIAINWQPLQVTLRVHSEDTEVVLEQTVTFSGDNELVQNRGSGKDEWWSSLPRAAWSENGVQALGEHQGWFELYRVKPNTYAIYEPGQFEEVISYLLVGNERALLFDTGLGIGDIKSVVSQVTDLEVVVVNSHTHYDHVGGNHQFETLYGTNTAYTKKHAAGRSHAEVKEFVGEGWIWKPTPEGFAPKTYRGAPFEITHTLSDGETIDLGGRKIEVLLTPGHAPDALCLLDREQGLLFTGDTYYPAPLYAHLEGSSFPEYQATAARLAALAPELQWVLPAHNEPLRPASALQDMHEAFEAVASGALDYTLTDGNREYRFGDITILTRETPA